MPSTNQICKFFLKLSVTDDEFLEKLLYFVEHLFEVLKNKMPLMAYTDKDCLKVV